MHVFLFDYLSDEMPSTNEETDFVEDVQMVVEVDFILSTDIRLLVIEKADAKSLSILRGNGVLKKSNKDNFQGVLVPLVALPGQTSKKQEFIEFKLCQFLEISPNFLGRECGTH